MDVYLINRTDRPERRKHAMAQFEEQNINAHVFPAVIKKPGWEGCRDSHLGCLVRILASEEMGLVCEDDVLFVESIDIAFEAMCELPVDWDILYLGCSPQEPMIRYSEHLYRVTKAWCTHAMLWNPRPNGAMEFIFDADDRDEIGKFDVFLSEQVMPKFNVFCVYPLVATQAEFPSDIARRSDVSTIAKNFNRFAV